MPMKTILRSLFGGLLASAFVMVANAANLAPGAFSAGTVKGNVTYKLAGTTEFIPLASGTALPQGATIKTGDASLVAIVFSNGAVATITEGSEVEITKFEQEVFSGPLPVGAEPSVSNTEIKIVNGAVTSKVAKLKTGSSYVVKSPVGAAGVRGTTFRVEYNSTTRAYAVLTLEGEVVATGNANGQDYTVRANQGTDGSSLFNLTTAQIRQIENAVNAAIDNNTGTPTGGTGTGPSNRGPSINADASINVSVNS